MLLLIDGYNLIKNSSSQLFVSDSLRKHYVNQLNIYCKRKNHKVILVFDGGNFSFPSRETEDFVTIIYSGYKSSADDVIKAYISENRSKDLLLISSDRELQKFAKSLKVEFISSKEFYQALYQKNEASKTSLIKSKDEFVKISDSNDKELDELMSNISNVAIIKEDDIISKKYGSSGSVSKNEKKVIKKIKKL